jgi:hypothetical protein
MRFLKFPLIVGLLLVIGLFVCCNKEPERMKSQPPNLKSGETKIHLPGKARSHDVAY